MFGRLLLGGGAALGIALVSVPAIAHHSYAMFDMKKEITVQGTVKQFLWTNPHSWVRMMVPDAKGQMNEWKVEMGPVGILAHLGWTPKTLIPGDKVSMTLHPMKDGGHGGDFVALNNGGHNKITNDGGAGARQKERAVHRGEPLD